MIAETPRTSHISDAGAPFLFLLLQLVEPRLSARLASLVSLPLPQLVRAGTEQLLRMSQLEGQLLEQLFGTSAGVIARPQQMAGAPAPGVINM